MTIECVKIFTNNMFDIYLYQININVASYSLLLFSSVLNIWEITLL